MADKREQTGGSKLPPEARWPAVPAPSVPPPPQVVRPGVMPTPVRPAEIVGPPGLSPDQLEFMAAVQEIAGPPAMEGCPGPMAAEAPAGECPGCPAPGARPAPMTPVGPAADAGPGFTLPQGGLGPEGCAFSTPAGPLAGSPIGDGGMSPFDGGVPPIEDGLVPPVTGEPIGPGFTLPDGGIGTVGCAATTAAGALDGATLGELGLLDGVGVTVAQPQDKPQAGRDIAIAKDSNRWKTELKPALDRANKIMDQAIKDLEDLLKDPDKHPDTKQRFNDYFGTTDAAAVQKVLDRYKKMKKFKEEGEKGTRFYDDSAAEDRHNRATTHNGGQEANWYIVFHDNFWTADKECSDSQPSIIIHELSHAVFDSGDSADRGYEEGPGTPGEEKKKKMKEWVKKQLKDAAAFDAEAAKASAKGDAEGQAAAEKLAKKARERTLNEADQYKFFAADSYYAVTKPELAESKVCAAEYKK